MADSPEVQDCVVTFRGECQGVGLQKRGPDDNHVCFIILTEDDGYWFVTKWPEQGTSSYWLPELIDCLEQAKDWLHRNAEKDGPWGLQVPDRSREGCKEESQRRLGASLPGSTNVLGEVGRSRGSQR